MTRHADAPPVTAPADVRRVPFPPRASRPGAAHR